MSFLGVPSISGPLAEFLQAGELLPGSEPGYQLCKTIYVFHPLGAKMVDAPIKMAMSQPREITIPLPSEERLREAFVEQWERDYMDTYIAQLAGTSRTYGIGSMAMIIDGMKSDEALPLDTLYKRDISFSIFDPLNTAGSLVLNQNPNAIDFMKVKDITVQGQTYSRDRTVVFMNERPIYIEYTNSAFGFVGRSVYQRVLYPLQAFLFCMKTDMMIARKAGVIIAKMKPAGSIIDSAMGILFGQKRSLLKEAEVDNVLGITPEEDIMSLDLTNMDGPYSLARKNILETIAAGDDMPAKLLNQETFAEGFGEGVEDSKYIAGYIERLQKWMRPAYLYADKITQHRAWNPDFFESIKAKDAEYAGMNYNTALKQWQNSFRAKHPSLIREPDSELIKVDEARLKGVVEVIEILAPILDPANRITLIQWACDNVNEFSVLVQAQLDLDFDILEQYELEKAESGGEDDAGVEGEEPKPPSPNRSDDSRVAGVVEGVKNRRRNREVSDHVRRLDDVEVRVANIVSTVKRDIALRGDRFARR
jgi:hypothetical protein